MLTRWKLNKSYYNIIKIVLDSTKRNFLRTLAFSISFHVLCGRTSHVKLISMYLGCRIWTNDINTSYVLHILYQYQ